MEEWGTFEWDSLRQRTCVLLGPACWFLDWMKLVVLSVLSTLSVLALGSIQERQKDRLTLSLQSFHIVWFGTIIFDSENLIKICQMNKWKSERANILQTLHPFLFKDYLVFDARIFFNEHKLYNPHIGNTLRDSKSFFLINKNGSLLTYWQHSCPWIFCSETLHPI